MKIKRVFLSISCLLAMLCPTVQGSAQEKINPYKKRIVGGEPTTIEEHPWQVAIVPKGQAFWCGGSLIADRWILSAAHCFFEDNGAPRIPDKALRVKIGVTNIATEGAWVPIEKSFVHPKYKNRPEKEPPYIDSHDFDVALIKLKTPLGKGRTIPLANKSLNLTGNLTVTGWGAIADGGASSAVLRTVPVPFVEKKDCSKPEAYGDRLRFGMICAGYAEGGKDSCYGDSGGPLVKGKKPNAILVGVVSWGDGCAAEKKYGIYTSVQDYNSWITATMKK